VRRILSTAVVLAMAIGLAACGDDDDTTSSDTTASGASSATAAPKPVDLRLGYFPNITHAVAIAGVDQGIIADALPANVTLKTSTFNAGPAAVEALLSGALDATYIGPNPAINAYSQSKGEAIRIIAGATSAGASLVTKAGVTSVDQLKGKTIATPQLGNTQDVALRAFLKEKGFNTDVQGGGDVSIKPQENAQTLETFKAGQIDGAWVPEPWASRLVLEGGGKVLVNEKDLWPSGEFVTTHLIVRTKFLEDHPEAVKGLLQGHVNAVDYVNENTAEAKTVVNAGIEKITGKPLKQEVIDRAWTEMTFTEDPISSSLKESAKDAAAVGLLDPVDLAGIYDLDLLNEILKDLGEAEVSAT
jgi:NitT/TauT family transport system substrate-binding protein